MELSLCAVRVNAIAVDDRARARSVVVSIAILEIGGVAETPVPGPRFGVHALHDLVIADAVQEHETVCDDSRRCVARTLREFPDQRRGQGAIQPCLGGSSVVGRTQK
jgi:hypothetical protein